MFVGLNVNTYFLIKCPDVDIVTDKAKLRSCRFDRCFCFYRRYARCWFNCSLSRIESHKYSKFTKFRFDDLSSGTPCCTITTSSTFITRTNQRCQWSFENAVKRRDKCRSSSTRTEKSLRILFCFVFLLNKTSWNFSDRRRDSRPGKKEIKTSII